MPRTRASPRPQGAGPVGASVSAPAGPAKPDAGETSSPVDTTASKTSPKGPVDRGGKATDSKSVGPIDLTRPDDGYGNLRRRAARPSLIAAQKKLQPVTAATVAPHPPASAMVDHPRNAAGAVVPGMSATPLGSVRQSPGRSTPNRPSLSELPGTASASARPLCTRSQFMSRRRPHRPSRQSPESTAQACTPPGSVSEDRRRITRPSPAHHFGISECQPTIGPRHRDTAGASA